MSNFEAAISVVLLHEGFYVNDASDPGGATNFGISLRWLKDIGDTDGDGFLDGDIDHDGDVDVEDIKKMQKPDAIKLYRTHWWDKYGYVSISDNDIATKTFDFAINMGSKQAHKCLQRAVRSASPTKTILEDDGALGAKSFYAVNQCNPQFLLCALRSESAGFYRGLNKPKYINGWLNRAYS